MQFGKIQNKNDLDKIDFSIPEYNIPNRPSTSESFKLYFGAPTFREKSWINKIYPTNIKDDEYLKYYSDSFNSIELNSSFYRVPDTKTILKWRSQVSKNFKFCPKISKDISHTMSITNTPSVRIFFDSVKRFDENLGIIFLQLSESFSPYQINELKRFIDIYPKSFELAIELRHPWWFSKDHEIFKKMQERSISSVITDVSGRRDMMNVPITSKNVMIRFVGNDLHPSDYTRIDAWVHKLKSWKEKDLDKVYFFIHEPDEKHTPEISEYFVSKCKEIGVGDIPEIKTVKKEEQISFI